MNPLGIYSCLAGGLGNQLFMYAAAKALANLNNINIYLDIDHGFVDDKRYNRKYSLDMFSIKYEKCAISDFRLGRKDKILNKIAPLRFRTIINERSTKKLAHLAISKPVLLTGYWQSERFFKHRWDDLSKDFVFNLSLSSTANKFLDLIRSFPNSFAVHFRRNDYRHALPIKYYKMALDLAQRLHSDAHFFIFSDIPVEIKSYILPDTPYTVINTFDDREDFYLMTSCNHQIIANSTFSWWSAYLNANHAKTIISPKSWGFDIDIPKSWILI